MSSTKTKNVLNPTIEKLTKKIFDEKLYLSKKSYKTYSYTFEERWDGNFVVASLYLLNMELMSAEGDRDKEVYIVKLKESYESDETVIDKHYQNESLFYTKVLKEFPEDYQDFTARHVYSDKDCIVLEKLQDFVPADKFNIYLPEDHIIKALTEIGKFHGLSYWLKEAKPAKAKEIRDNIQLLYNGAKNYEWNFMQISVCLMGASDYYRKNFESSQKFSFLLDELDIKFKNIFDYFKDVMVPTEPLATVVHGDFNKFNILFKYNENDMLDQVKLIDWQILSYGSPALDLAFFVYMNIDVGLRRKNFHRYFDIYYNSLMNQLESRLSTDKNNNTIKNSAYDLSKYSREHFLEDYRNHLLHGFATAIGFKSTILGVTVEGLRGFKMWTVPLEEFSDFVKKHHLTEGVRKHIAADLEELLEFLVETS